MCGWLLYLQMVTTGIFRQLFVSIYVCGTKNVTVYFFVEKSSTSTGRLTLKLCIFSYWNRYEVLLVQCTVRITINDEAGVM